MATRRCSRRNCSPPGWPPAANREAADQHLRNQGNPQGATRWPMHPTPVDGNPCLAIDFRHHVHRPNDAHECHLSTTLHMVAAISRCRKRTTAQLDQNETCWPLCALLKPSHHQRHAYDVPTVCGDWCARAVRNTS